PISLRLLGVFIPDVLVTATLLAAAGGVLVAHTALSTPLSPRDLPLLPFAAALVIAMVFLPWLASLRAVTNRLVLRRCRPHPPPLGSPLPEHRDAGRLLPRGRRRGFPGLRRPARPPARRRGPARPHGRGRALARARREARRARRAGGAHRARDPQPGDRRTQPGAAALAGARAAVGRRAPPHPRSARSPRPAGGGAAPLRAPRGAPL